jgi:hypothetical protein
MKKVVVWKTMEVLEASLAVVAAAAGSSQLRPVALASLSGRVTTLILRPSVAQLLLLLLVVAGKLPIHVHNSKTSKLADKTDGRILPALTSTNSRELCAQLASQAVGSSYSVCTIKVFASH